MRNRNQRSHIPAHTRSMVHLMERLMSDQVLILSLLRNETFLNTAAPNVSESVHVGCAGLQDRPDLFLTVSRPPRHASHSSSFHSYSEA